MTVNENTIIGHFKLDKRLGEGRFGTVFRALDVNHPKIYAAIKVIHPELQKDKSVLKEVRRNFKALNRLHHPNIVGFRDLLLDGAQAAIVTELLSGRTIQELVNEEPLNIHDAIRVMEELLDGLAYAHSEGVVHGDLRTENIHVTKKGRLKIVDFGLAQAILRTRNAQSLEAFLSQDHRAPELTPTCEATPASDVYSLGISLWAMLAGKSPVPDGDFDFKRGWHATAGPTDIRVIRHDCPDWLVKVLTTMLSIDLSIRYPNAESARMGLWQARLEDDNKQRRRSAAPPSRTTISTGVLARVLLNHAKNRSLTAPSLVDQNRDSTTGAPVLDNGPLSASRLGLSDNPNANYNENDEMDAYDSGTSDGSRIDSRSTDALLKHGEDEFGCPACGRSYDLEVAKGVPTAPQLAESDKKSKPKKSNTWKDKKASRGVASRELATSPPLTRQDFLIGGLLTLLSGISAAIIGAIFWALLP
jgi:serine/threonine protein kinase